MNKSFPKFLPFIIITFWGAAALATRADYRILGVRPGATLEEAREAKRSLLEGLAEFPNLANEANVQRAIAIIDAFVRIEELNRARRSQTDRNVVEDEDDDVRQWREEIQERFYRERYAEFRNLLVGGKSVAEILEKLVAEQRRTFASGVPRITISDLRAVNDLLQNHFTRALPGPGVVDLTPYIDVEHWVAGAVNLGEQNLHHYTTGETTLAHWRSPPGVEAAQWEKLRSLGEALCRWSQDNAVTDDTFLTAIWKQIEIRHMAGPALEAFLTERMAEYERRFGGRGPAFVEAMFTRLLYHWHSEMALNAGREALRAIAMDANGLETLERLEMLFALGNLSPLIGMNADRTRESLETWIATREQINRDILELLHGDDDLRKQAARRTGARGWFVRQVEGQDGCADRVIAIAKHFRLDLRRLPAPPHKSDSPKLPPPQGPRGLAGF